ncbi:hypothetical protein [Paenibacillus ehimensis]|uniref:Transposase n=1 Tax=Paenibacillus ehimensis TaxID=79264 RepID=A0ABT8VI56_9BACL|nr:hypothetical protein [Paenibacillus ehimensis]MDO3680670.1 hypothetical protein [Paenibacillus ehimensis]
MSVKVEGTYLTPEQRDLFKNKKSTRRPGQVLGLRNVSVKNILIAIVQKLKR